MILCVCEAKIIFRMSLILSHGSHTMNIRTKKGGSLTTGDKRNSKDFLMKKEGINIFIFQSFFFHMVKTILFCVTFRQSIWEWLVCEAGIKGNLRSCSEWPHSPQHQPDPPYLDENYFSVWWTKKFHTQNFLSAFFNWKSHFFHYVNLGSWLWWWWREFLGRVWA